MSMRAIWRRVHAGIVVKTSLISLMFCFSLTAKAETAVWTIIPAKSSLSFTATQNGAPVDGAFKVFTGQIDFSVSDLPASHVEISVDTGSVTASYSDLVDTLKTPDWFNVSVFPKAVFKASQFKKLHDKTYQADGVLTIRDKSKPVVITFEIEEMTDTNARVKGSTTLQRNDFGVGQGDWASTTEIKNEVKVNFVLSAVKK